MPAQAALAYWLARDARSVARALERDEASLRALAAQRLRTLLSDAMRSPCHAERLRTAGLARAGALPDAELPRALESLAPVSKQELRDAGAAALRDGTCSHGWFSSHSSGSSGEPFRVYYDARAWATLKYLVKVRARRAAGMTLSERVAVLDAIPTQAEGSALLERAGRLQRISVFREPAEIAAMLASFRPSAIYALPSALLEVGRAMECDDAPHLRVRNIFTSGELLGASARRAITSAFGCALSDVYGTSETKEIAWECAAGSRHINSDVVHVEILDEHDAPVHAGVEGEIVVTLLVNRAMPLIRYRTGDRGALLATRCSCGRSAPLLGVVTGREADIVELADGSTRSPYALTMALERTPGLAQFRIVQVERDRFTVSAVTNARVERESLEHEIEVALRSVLLPDTAIHVAVVSTLPRAARAKIRVVEPLPRAHALAPELAAAPGGAR